MIKTATVASPNPDDREQMKSGDGWRGGAKAPVSPEVLGDELHA